MSFVADILESARAHAAEPLLLEVHGSNVEPCSGSAFVETVGRARAWLRRAGVVAGDRVALLAPNSARWAAVDLAIMAEGAIVVPLYARQDPHQLAGMLDDATPRVVIAADGKLAAALTAAWPKACPVAIYDELFACQPVVESSVPIAAAAPVTIIYTSGTSGEPKGAVLTADNVEFMLDVTVQRIAQMSVGTRNEDRVFHYLPFCFAGSRIMLWSQLRRGNPLWISTNLDNLQEELRTAKPHYYLNVPVLLERIRKGVETRLAGMGKPVWALHQRAFAAQRAGATGATAVRERMWLMLAQKLLFPRIKQLIGPNLEFLICGSARLSEETQRWFEMIGLPVYQVYGLTETTGIVTIDDTKHVEPGRVGYAVPGCEIKLSEDGELMCRGRNVFAGYWNRPEATAQTVRDGWLYTGDQAVIDDSGSLQVVGRLKDVIVPESGHNVAPAPIEEKLVLSGTGIEQAVVVGHGRPFLTAIVTGQVGQGELDRARDAVNAQLPHYQRLRKLYHAPEPFTIESGLLTANQKLRRRVIEQHYQQAIEELYR